MNEKEVIVKGGDALKIQYEAQGFRHAFFVLIDKTGNDKFSNYGDPLSVIATVGCFSLELYFKFLIVLSNYDEDKDEGMHMKQHKFNDLYSDLEGKEKNQSIEDLHSNLRSNDKSYTDDLDVLYEKIKHKNGGKTLKDFLSNINNYFQKWRYPYCYGEMKLYLNTLADVLNLMNDYSTQKWLEKASMLGHLEFSSNDESCITYDHQVLLIDDFDALKEESLFSFS